MRTGGGGRAGEAWGWLGHEKEALLNSGDNQEIWFTTQFRFPRRSSPICSLGTRQAGPSAWVPLPSLRGRKPASFWDYIKPPSSWVAPQDGSQPPTPSQTSFPILPPFPALENLKSILLRKQINIKTPEEWEWGEASPILHTGIHNSVFLYSIFSIPLLCFT